MNKVFPIVLIVLLIGGVYLFFLSTQKTSDRSSKTNTSSASSQTIPPTIDLGAGGSSYLDKKGVYSILYPNDYTLDTQDPQHIRIYRTGTSQRPQSEMSDGALAVFESIDLQGESLETLVDARILEATADGTSEIVAQKKPIIHNTYPGFNYSLRGLRVSQYLVLQKDTNSKNAVVITYSISDPDQKDYQSEINAMLTSLKLLK